MLAKAETVRHRGNGTGILIAPELSMTLALNRFRIRSRIYGGFAALIVLVLAVALFGATQFAATGGQVGSLVTVSDQMARVLTVQRLLETLNRASLRYQTKGDKAL